MNRRQELTLGSLGALLAFGACEAVGRAGIVRRSYLPPASEVLARAVELAGDHTFLDDVAVTLRAWALGLAIACAIAIPLGLLLGSVPVVDDAVRAVIEFLRPLPSVALIPLVSLLLGAGTETEVTLITYASIWPILFNTVYGLGETDPLAKDTLRAFGFGRLSILLRVELPATAPFIVAGLRISAATALVLATATELLSGFGQGLGIFIAQAQLATDGTRDVLAGVVWAGALGLVINGVLVRLERLAFPWRAGARGAQGAARGELSAAGASAPGGLGAWKGFGRGGARRDGHGVARRGGSGGAGPTGSAAGSRGGPDEPGSVPPDSATGRPAERGGEVADGGAST
ncbi:ABC transporter permease [Streptomyces prunicolor]|uniref:ABC transporter permease n=1 Tax=Streptomyces prunicolor TaxID=67348 RepID=UPI003724769D